MASDKVLFSTKSKIIRVIRGNLLPKAKQFVAIRVIRGNLLPKAKQFMAIRVIRGNLLGNI